MSKRRARVERLNDRIDHTAEITPAAALPTTELAIANREAMKREIAKAILPFFKDIARSAQSIQTTYDRGRLELIVEACRDYLMPIAEADPELTFDQQLGIAEIVSGVAKGWSFARELLDKGGAEKLLPLYVVLTEKIEQVADAIDLKVVYRGESEPVGVTRDVLEELVEVHAIESKDTPRASPE